MGDKPDHHHYLILANRWASQAEDNVQKWGIQTLDAVLLAAVEEFGELVQAHLEARAEGRDPVRVERELADLAALMFQIQWAYEETDYEQFDNED